jgi:hypothetical protein
MTDEIGHKISCTGHGLSVREAVDLLAQDLANYPCLSERAEPEIRSGVPIEVLEGVTL